MEQRADTEVGGGGISRRDLIAKSVAAGGLVWAAPVLLSGPASAQTQIPCCAEGIAVTIKVAEQGGVNCGVACLSHRGSLNFPCPDELAACLEDPDLDLVVGDFTEGGQDTAHIILAPGIGLISAAVQASNRCYFADCPCFASSQTDASCPNTCTTTGGNPQPCDFGDDPPLPPDAGGLNRIWVVFNGDGSTDVFVNTHPDNELNHVELSVCVSPAVYAQC